MSGEVRHPVLAFVGYPGAGVTTACKFLREELGYPSGYIIDGDKDIELRSPNDLEWFKRSYLTGLVVAIHAPLARRHTWLEVRDGVIRTPLWREFADQYLDDRYRFRERPPDRPNTEWLMKEAPVLVYNCADEAYFTQHLTEFVSHIRAGQEFGSQPGFQHVYGSETPWRFEGRTPRSTIRRGYKPLKHAPPIRLVESDDPEVDGQPFL